ncbi:hypothetical protein GCM10022261_16280 [Brevibacterium daeguense]|uniref:Uncharacterized protein n=1 Tax=Brevibacterium daeguense TaxID=909936 RepID=A0ABP8EJI5_9MICO|nr:hypothetical protein [Brevibacterium daeguense]
MTPTRLLTAPNRHLGATARVWWAALVVCAAVLVVVLVVDALNRLAGTRGIFPAFAHPVFDSDRDRGLAETVGYLQLLVAAGALVYTALSMGRASIHYVFAAAFVVVIADDGLELHENWGGAVSDTLGFRSAIGLRGQDFGELVVWGLLSLPIVVALLITWFRSSIRARRQAVVITGGIVLLVFFAAVLDGLGPASGLLGWSDRARYLVKLVESAGELGSMSVIMLSALFFALRQRLRSAHPEHAAGEALDGEQFSGERGDPA